MANKSLIKPIYDEWWARGPIVAASKQHEKDIEQAFYVGWYAAMGMIARMNKAPNDVAVRMASDMIAECRVKIMPKTMTKVTATIDGNKFN